MNTAANIDVANPFLSIAGSNREAARILACAFAVAHHLDDVFAALRMHRKCGGVDLSGYLMGCHFEDWHLPGYDHNIGPDGLPELRDMAHEFLEGGV